MHVLRQVARFCQRFPGISVKIETGNTGADARVCALPIIDCQRRLKETLVCLNEQRSRRLVATFMEMFEEDLPTA